MKVRAMALETAAEAVGREHRSDPVVGASGGPAGNARLTAWTGAVLLVLLAVEGATLLDIHGFITWHLVIGVVLIPPVLLKTATTGWRILRYYTGKRPYRDAGPPPMPLRLLGPLVVVSTLAVLASGLVLILIGPAASRRPLLGAPGRSVDAVMLHKATFVVWFGVTALHVLGRLVPALRLTLPSASRPVPGGGLARSHAPAHGGGGGGRRGLHRRRGGAVAVPAGARGASHPQHPPLSAAGGQGAKALNPSRPARTHEPSRGSPTSRSDSWPIHASPTG